MLLLLIGAIIYLKDKTQDKMIVDFCFVFFFLISFISLDTSVARKASIEIGFEMHPKKRTFH